MARTTTSLRLDDELRERLAMLAAAERTSVTSIVERMLREGLAMADHPGITFKPGFSGRRAALAGGPDVWAIASAVRRMSGTEAERIASLAEEFGIHERQVAIALDYAAVNAAEIAALVDANERAWQEAERVEAARKRLLA